MSESTIVAGAADGSLSVALAASGGLVERKKRLRSPVTVFQISWDAQPLAPTGNG